MKLAPVANDVVKLMQRLKQAHDPVRAKLLRAQIDARLSSMTASSQHAALVEARRRGFWP